MSATPAKHFALGPYKVELFSSETGLAGVMNRNGVNCLTFDDRPGAVMTTFAEAKRIAEQWNKEGL